VALVAKRADILGFWRCCGYNLFMMESLGVRQFTDKQGLRRLQGSGMWPLDSATPYPAHASGSPADHWLMTGGTIYVRRSHTVVHGYKFGSSGYEGIISDDLQKNLEGASTAGAFVAGILGN